MRAVKVLSILAVLFVLCPPVPATAALELFDGRASADFAGSFGYQDKWVDGGQPSQFEAYRDVPRGFVWETLHLYAEWEDPERPYYLRVFGRDLFQEDQTWGLDAGKRGDWLARLGYKETPRTIDPDDHLIRRQGTAEAAKTITDGVGVRLTYRHDDKDGRMPAADTGLHQRIDWDSDILKAALELTRSEGLVQLVYEYQDFRDGVGINSGGVILGGGVLHDPAPPDGHTHIGRLTGSWALPFWRSRLAWSASGGGTWQDGGQAGEVLNFVQDYSLYMRPADRLEATVKYRYYYYDNMPHFPSPAFPASFLRQDARLDFDYNVSSLLTARAGLGWERLRSWTKGPGLTDNFSAGPGLTFTPLKTVQFLLDYRWSNARREYKASTVFTMVKGLDLRANGQYISGSRDSDGLVLTRGRAWSAGTEASWAPLTWLGVSAGYAHREGREPRQDLGGSLPASSDSNDSFSAGLSATDLSGRAGLAASCVYNRGAVTVSPDTPAPGSNPLYREARAEVFYRLQRGLTVSLRYTFEKSDTGAGPRGDTGYTAQTGLARLACRF